MSDFFELIYLFFFRPREAWPRLREGIPWWWSVAVFCGVYLFGQALDLAAGPAEVEGLPLPPGFDAAALRRVFAVLGLPLALILWFLEAAVWHLLAQFFGAQGRGTTLFLALGFTTLPLLIGQGADALLSLGAGASWSRLLTAVSAVWAFVLQVMAVKETHGLSTGRALAVVLFPLAVLVVMAVATLAMLVPLISPVIFRQLP